MTNPLLAITHAPNFSAIKPEHIEPAISQLIADNLASLEKLLAQTEYTWECLIEPIEHNEDKLSRAWSAVSHLHAVMNQDALRDAYNACLPKLTAYATQLGQNKKLYEAYKSIQQSQAYTKFSTAKKKSLDNDILDFELSGVHLDEDKKQQYKELSEQLSQLTTQFEQNLMDATDNWEHLVVNVDDLRGVPEWAISQAKQKAQSKEMTGYLLGIDFPTYYAVVTYCENRELRELLYTAYCTRASDVGPQAGKWDNSSVMVDIIKKRHALAQLLGYGCYAERSLVKKMAVATQDVLAFLYDLVKRSRPQAKEEFATLRQYVTETFGVSLLAPWDLSFYAEKYQQQKLQVDQEAYRAYFPIDKVLKGLFEICQRLYDIRVEAITDRDVWHKDVRVFALYDEHNNLRAECYLDLYAREKKRGGAWMDECRTRHRCEDHQVQIPIAYITCNFAPASENNPALLSHDEVLTLFHEMGHGLHHMLTTINISGVSGINGVAWDAVELPSQFFENWCWQKEGLNLISGHYKTNETLPDVMLKNLLAAKNYNSAMAMLRQLEFALFDFRLYSEIDEGVDNLDVTHIQKVLDDVRKAVAVVPVATFNRFQHGFSHIFAGGYAAGYYSYKWAEVLAADAFAKFEEQGIFDKATGHAFLNCILEKGGSEDALDLFKAFRGREPNVDALLRHSGIKS